MKVCHITSVHKQDDSRIFHKECRSVAMAGHETVLLVMNGVDAIIENVQIKGVSYTVKGRIRRILFAGKAMINEAVTQKADIYHLHDPELLRIAVKLKKRSGGKVVYDSHEDLPKQIMDKHWIPGFIRGFISKMAHRYEMRIAKKIDGIVSVTDLICSRFKLANNNVALVANYPILEEMEMHRNPSLTKKENAICYIGGLFPTRGIKELVLALEHSRGHLLLAGNFSTPEFEQEVRSLEGWKKVEYFGHVDRAKIVEILQSSHVGLVTLHPTKSYQEALPIKLFEYMSAGIPTIASNFVMWEQLVIENKCGLMVDPLDPIAIGEKIDYLLDHPQEAERMGENGRKAVVRKYSWQVQVENLLTLYNRLVHS